jgi:hypothetical protein
MPARDELNRQWQANEAELNRLHSMRKLVDNRVIPNGGRRLIDGDSNANIGGTNR